MFIQYHFFFKVKSIAYDDKEKFNDNMQDQSEDLPTDSLAMLVSDSKGR